MQEYGAKTPLHLLVFRCHREVASQLGYPDNFGKGGTPPPAVMSSISSREEVWPHTPASQER